VYIAVGAEELTRPAGRAVREFATRLNGHASRGLRVVSETLPGETHVSAPAAAITHGLKAVFENH
jgi:hypothetical protein